MLDFQPLLRFGENRHRMTRLLRYRYAPLQNLPDGKPALFRLFAAGRTPCVGVQIPVPKIKPRINRG